MEHDHDDAQAAEVPEDPGQAADQSARAEKAEQQESSSPGVTVKDRRYWTQGSEDGEDEEQRSQVPSYVEQLQNRLEEKDKQLKEYIAAYKTEVVEGLERTKERLKRDSAEQLEQLKGQMASPMLDVLEALDRSVIAAETNATVESLLEGIKLVQLLMVQKLQELGLSRVQTTGQPFDPQLHEAISVAPTTDPAQDNTVIQEVRPGFMMGDRLIRAASVVVGQLQKG